MKAIKRRASLITLALLLLVQFVAFMPVKAESTVFSSNYEILRKMDLRGVFATDRFYFTVDKYWSVQSGVIRLSLTQSELIDNEQMSTLTVSLNGHPISSKRLKDLAAHRTFIEIPIFVDYLKTEVNEIKIEVYRRSSDNQCSDEVSSANWLTLHENSSINLQYTEIPPTNIIGEYPYPFFRQSTVSKPDTAIVVPNNPDNAELEAALMIATAFGQYSQGKECDLTVRKYTDMNDKDAWNIIYVGLRRNTPGEISTLMPQPDDRSASLKKMDSPFNQNKKMLAIVSQEGIDLVRAARLLSNPSLAYQIKADTYTLNRDMNVLIPEIVRSDSVTLESLGYNGINLAGSFRQQSVINIRLPRNRVVDDRSKVVLNMRYSENLDFRRALMTLFVNGIPIGSKKLEKEKAQNDTFTIEIPKEARKTNYVELKVAFDLEIADLYCTPRQQETPWAYIKGDSYLYIPTGLMSNYVFENFPCPFSGDDMWNSALFVSPDNPSDADLTTMANIACAVGREIRTNRGTLNVTRGSSVSDAQSKMNIIAIGSPSSNTFLRTINNYMFFKYDEGFDYFKSNEKISLIKEYSRTMGTIQLLNSHYDKYAAILAITAPDSKNMHSAAKYIWHPQLVFKLVGDGSFVDQWGELRNFRFKTTETRKDYSKTESMVWFFLGFSGVFVIVLVFGLVIYNRMQKRKQQ